jgi:putative sigma-54 modulation protein
MLKVDIKGTEMELTESIVASIETKLATLDKYLATAGSPCELRVEVGKTTHHHNKGQLFRAEANLKIPGHLIRAEETSYKLYDALDLVKDQLKREILKITKSAVDEKRAGAREAKEQGTETKLV